MFYTCTTPNCAIALSKATFPVAMNCPVCQVPLELQVQESILTPEDQSLLESLPYVIAYPLKRTLEEKHAWTKINLLKDTFLNYLKYLGLLTASEFFNSDLKNRRMVDAFQKNLAQPSFGSWNAFIRECITFLKQQNHTFFYPELLVYYESIETGPKRKLYKGEIEYIDSNGDAQLKKQETTAIGLLINFRNRYLGHGLTIDEQASQQLWMEYFPVFKTLLEQLSFAKEYPMLKREHGETYLLQGAELKEINSAHILDGSIWIENKQGEAFEILPFYIVPGALALAKEDKEQVLSYESFTGKTIKFFSPEGSEKQTSGVILEKLNLLLRNKQKETTFSPETFTKEVFINRIEEENKLVIDTLIQEKKVIEGIYQNRETIEIKLREWIGARANIFFIAAEAGSGKTNLLVEIQKQYLERNLSSLLIRACRMEKQSLKEQIAYLLNLDSSLGLNNYTVISGTQAEPTFILIDGLNETSNAEEIWQEVLELSQIFVAGSLKFVITSRANSKADIERYTLTKDTEIFIYGENTERENGLAAFVYWLTPLNMVEMKAAWEDYVKKDKNKFKPLFTFDDLATFDRSLYNQISNPLVLRLFLETYHGKKLPEKGNQHLNIWKDWLSSFSEEEQTFMKLLAAEIWEKGENELLLDDLLKRETLKLYFTSDVINSPYHRLKNLGWISRYVKDLNSYVSFTVEGALLYLLAQELYVRNPKFEDIMDVLENANKLKRSAVEVFLSQKAIEGNLLFVAELIDLSAEYIELCVNPLLTYLKTFGSQSTIEELLKSPTANDWKAFFELDNRLEDLQLNNIRTDFYQKIISEKFYNTNEFILILLKSIEFLNEKKSKLFLKRIYEKTERNNLNHKILYQLGWSEFLLGNYDKSIDLFEKSLSKIDRKLNSLEYSQTMNELGIVLTEKGDLDQALKINYAALTIRKQFNSDFSNKIAESYINLANTFYEKCDFENATKYNFKALELTKKITGEYHTQYAILLNNQGTVFDAMGDYNKAIEFYGKSLKILTSLYNEDSFELAKICNNLGLSYLHTKDIDSALTFSLKSLDLYLKKYDSENTHLSSVYSNLGSIYHEKDDFQNAKKFYQKCLASQSSRGDFYPRIATTYSNLGLLHLDQREFKKAQDYFNMSLKIDIKNFGENHHGVATTYNNLGLLNERMSNFDLAIKNYKKSLKIYQNTIGNEHPGMISIYSNLGRLLNYQMDFEKSEEYFKKAKEIIIKNNGNDSIELASLQSHMACMYDNKGNFDQSISFFRDSLEIYLKKLVDNHPFIATNYNSIGLILVKKGLFNEALEHFKIALSLRISYFGNTHFEVAMIYFNIGKCYLEKEDYKASIEAFSKGFSFYRKGGFPFQIAQCYEALSDKVKALDYYIQSATIRKDDPEIGLEAETTLEAITNAKRLAKETGKEDELPIWMR